MNKYLTLLICPVLLSGCGRDPPLLNHQITTEKVGVRESITPEIQCASTTQAVVVDDILVQVLDVSIGKVEWGRILLGPTLSDNKLLTVKLLIQNNSKTKIVRYTKWGGDLIPVEQKPTVLDNYNNRYYVERMGDCIVGGMKFSSDTIYPVKSVTDVVAFEPLVENITELKLELP